jgi:hypothetical protein
MSFTASIHTDMHEYQFSSVHAYMLGQNYPHIIGSLLCAAAAAADVSNVHYRTGIHCSVCVCASNA